MQSEILLLVLLAQETLTRPPAYCWSFVSGTSSDLNPELLDELDEFELKILRDFARGKGHGTVSRLPIDDLLDRDDQESESGVQARDKYDPSDPLVVDLRTPVSQHLDKWCLAKLRWAVHGSTYRRPALDGFDYTEASKEARASHTPKANTFDRSPGRAVRR